jgi:hypothetical protein
VSARDSIHYRVLSGLRRDEIIDQPRILGGTAAPDTAEWWRLVDAA